MKLRVSGSVVLQILLSIVCFYGSYISFKRGTAAWATNGTYIPIMLNIAPFLFRIIGFLMIVVAIYIMYKFGTKGILGSVITIIGAAIVVFFGATYGFVAGILGLVGSYFVIRNLFKKDLEEKSNDSNDKHQDNSKNMSSTTNESKKAEPVEQEIVDQPNNYSDY
ncbi:hypothetical protein [Mycoplasma sp. P36-A1]|uniref:hypothetical protein n=1 Tax=Mycoplasma sp. P36-A1 TaxID=3252900 RepID=UPI003C2B41D4